MADGYDNHCDLTNKKDRGQHLQFLRCLCVCGNDGKCGNVWQCIAMFDNVWQGMVMYGGVWQYMAKYGSDNDGKVLQCMDKCYSV